MLINVDKSESDTLTFKQVELGVGVLLSSDFTLKTITANATETGKQLVMTFNMASRRISQNRMSY